MSSPGCKPGYAFSSKIEVRLTLPLVSPWKPGIKCSRRLWPAASLASRPARVDSSNFGRIACWIAAPRFVSKICW